MKRAVHFLLVLATASLSAEPLQYKVSSVGNSFSGADGKWVQNFFIHTKVQPDGTVNTWSHWDEGGKKFGVYKDENVIGNEDVKANSLEVADKAGRRWKLIVEYTDPKHNEWDFVPRGIECDGKAVAFPELEQPTALALANDGQLMVADSLTGSRQQILFYDIADPQHPRLTRAFGERGGIASGKAGEIAPTKFWGIRGTGMDAAGNLYGAMSEMGAVLRLSGSRCARQPGLFRRQNRRARKAARREQSRARLLPRRQRHAHHRRGRQ